jgi:hypothetical protein
MSAPASAQAASVPVLTAEEQARLTQRVQALAKEDELYMRQHPELKQMVDDFMRAVLEKRPADVIQFAHEFFKK